MWLVNSNKPKAREFRKWITNEILPVLDKNHEVLTSCHFFR